MSFQHQFIRLEGSARERGLTYGKVARERIARCLNFYKKFFKAHVNLDWEEAKALALQFKPDIEAYFPETLVEMQSIAEGAGVNFEDILALNCRSEILFALPDGCTAVSFPPQATRDGNTVLAQTWDWLEPARDCTVVLEVNQAPLPRILMVAEAGMVGGKGINEDGIGVTLNALSVGKGRIGVPLHVMYRKILSAAILTDAIDAVTQAKRGGCGNFNIGSACGIVSYVEFTPDDFAIEMSEGEPLCHTNHYLSPLFIKEDALKRAISDSFVRLNRVRVLTKGQKGYHVDSILNVFCDHSNFPDSVCSHPDPNDPEMMRMCTIYAVVFDLTRREIWVTNSNPCQGPAYPFRFSS